MKLSVTLYGPLFMHHLRSNDTWLSTVWTQHMERYLLLKSVLSYIRVFKVKLSQYDPKVNMRFHIFWNFQYLLSKLLEGFDIKQHFHVKNYLSIYIVRYFAQISKLKRVFVSKSTFHWSIMMSSMKLPYLENSVFDFKTFYCGTWAQEQQFRK